MGAALQLALTGQITSGPGASSGGQFPSGVKTISFATVPDPLTYQVESGDTVAVQSPSPDYVTIPAVGTISGVLCAVTQGVALFLNTNTAPFKVRLTMADPAGGSDIVSILNVNGPLFLQFPTNGYLKLLEVSGSGTVEFHVWGNQ